MANPLRNVAAGAASATASLGAGYTRLICLQLHMYQIILVIRRYGDT